MTKKILDRRHWHPFEQASAGHEAANQMDGAALEAAIARTLPAYASAVADASNVLMPDDICHAARLLPNVLYDEALVPMLVIYVEISNALSDFLAEHHTESTRPTITTVRHNLNLLEAAMTKLCTVWDQADVRTKEILYQTVGKADGSPLKEQADFAAVWQRGACRMVKFRDRSRWIKEEVAAARSQLPRQDRRSSLYDGLVGCLADIFEKHSRRPLTLSQKRESLTDFVTAIAATLPAECAPSPGEVGSAVRRTVKERRCR